MKTRRILCIAAALCMLCTAAHAGGLESNGSGAVNIAAKAVMPYAWETQTEAEMAGTNGVSALVDGSRETGYQHACIDVQSADSTPEISFYFDNATIRDIWIRNGWENGAYYYAYFARAWAVDVTVWCGNNRYDQGRKYLEDSNNAAVTNVDRYDGYQRIALNQLYQGVTRVDIYIRQWYQGAMNPNTVCMTDMLFMPDTLDTLYGTGIYSYITPTPVPTAAVNIAQSAMKPYDWTVEDRNGQAIGWNIANLFDGKWSTTMGFVCWSAMAKDEIPDISLFFNNATIREIWLRNGFQASDRLDYARIRQLEVTIWSGDTNYGTQKFKDLIDSIDTAERSANMYDGYQRLALKKAYQNVTRVDLVIKGWYPGPEDSKNKYKMLISDMVFLPDSLESIYGSGIFDYGYYPVWTPTAAPRPTATPTPRTTATPKPGAGMQVQTNQRLATRSGPGTNYTETGSYFQKGTVVKALSAAYDKSNRIWWIQVELTYMGEQRRVYTGVKRLDMSAEWVPTETEQGSAVLTRSVYPYWGPGYGYTMYDKTIPSGTTGTIWMRESSYVQFEYYDTGLKQFRRVWVPANAVEEDDGNG